MRVMTFNIQHGQNYRTQQIDLPLFVETVREVKADICGLNEVRGEGPAADYTDQMAALSNGTGFHAYFAEAFKVFGENPYGNGLLSRYPIMQAETVSIPAPQERPLAPDYEPRCVLRAVIEADGKPLCILSCHMGLCNAERRQAVATICGLLDSETLPVILMGDFNAAPSDPVLRPLFARLSDSDALAAVPGKYTFASYAPKCKIDYLLYRGLVCRSVATVEKIVSDHFALVADFDW